MTLNDDPRSGSPGTTRLAAFDFDGTLTNRDSVVPFLYRMLGLSASGRMARRLLPMVSSVLGRDRDRLRAVVSEAVFRDVAYDAVVHTAERYASSSLVRHLRTDTVERLRRHVADGDVVVIVSASYREYLEPLGREWGVAAVIATELDVRNVDGELRCSGALVGGNCRGQAKVDRLEQWLAQQGVHREEIEMWAYGDSSGDRELLAWADHPQWVRSQRPNISSR